MEESERGSDLELVTALYRTTNTVVRELDQRLTREHDVTFVQAVTLLAIDSFEQPQPHLVAQYLSQQSQTVTGVLDRIERAGLIERLRDMSDRRAVRLVLTPKGDALVQRLRDSLEVNLRAVLAGVGKGARTRLSDDLDDVERSALHATAQ
ncbi:MAG: MarR family winged helix-turn-helix transcriptional regulator [Dehalococcoidia bacterium]